MKVAGEPGLYAGVGSDDLYKLAGVLSAVVQPAAAINHVILLKNAKSRSHGRCMTEDENTPSLTGRTLLHRVLKPLDLQEGKKQKN